MFSDEALSDEVCLAASQAAEFEFAEVAKFPLDCEAHERFGVPATEEAVLQRAKETIPQNMRKKME